MDQQFDLLNARANEMTLEEVKIRVLVLETRIIDVTQSCIKLRNCITNLMAMCVLLLTGVTACFLITCVYYLLTTYLSGF